MRTKVLVLGGNFGGLTAALSVKHGLHGRNWQRRFTWAWLKARGVYRLSGQVRGGAAHALR